MKTHRKRVVEGLGAASEASGLSVDLLKRMKAAGCDAFEPGNRIDWKKAKEWAEVPENLEKATPKGDSLNLKDQKLTEEIRKLRRANDVADEKLMPVAQHQTEIREMANAVQGVLNGLPGRFATELAGRSPADIETRSRLMIDEAIGKLSRGESA